MFPAAGAGVGAGVLACCLTVCGVGAAVLSRGTDPKVLGEGGQLDGPSVSLRPSE